MKKLFAALLCLAMSLSLVACGGNTPPATTPGATPAAKTGAYTAGTYTASAKGNGGDVKVEVVVTADAITKVTVLEHKETQGISDPALEQIPAKIVEAQGLKIDAVAGATITSEAILAAVTDCLTQAGADIAALKEKGLVAQQLADETMTADVLVVGGGLAGLSAAVSAAENGADVILVEKMGALGGASITCGGEILAAGTDMQKAQSIEDSTDALAQFWIETGAGKVNEELIRYVANSSPDTVNWLKGNGVEFGEVTFSYNDPNQSPMRNHATAAGTGAGFIQPMAAAAEKAGVRILTETPAVELINDNGTIKGAVCENGGRKITVNAPCTVLATGGFANNEELMKQYCPAMGTYGTFLGEAHQGDGLIMARDAGAEIVAGGGSITNPRDGGATKFADAGGIFLNITPAGKRYANEASYWFSRSAKLYFDEGYNYYYGLMDSKTQNEGFEQAVADGTAFKADTIEDLAKQMGIDPAVLTATVERYNSFCATGVDEDFGKSAKGMVGARAKLLHEAQLLNSIDQAPFYAVSFTTDSITGTLGGPKVTLDGEVVSTAGSVIPGLYAAGEVANGEFFYRQYPCSGSSIEMCATLGRRTGAAAAAAAGK